MATRHVSPFRSSTCLWFCGLASDEGSLMILVEVRGRLLVRR